MILTKLPIVYPTREARQVSVERAMSYQSGPLYVKRLRLRFRFSRLHGVATELLRNVERFLALETLGNQDFADAAV